jgi:hypothetical protein
VRISQNAAVAIGLVVLDGDGKPAINNLALVSWSKLTRPRSSRISRRTGIP